MEAQSYHHRLYGDVEDSESRSPRRKKHCKYVRQVIEKHFSFSLAVATLVEARALLFKYLYTKKRKKRISTAKATAHIKRRLSLTVVSWPLSTEWSRPPMKEHNAPAVWDIRAL